MKIIKNYIYLVLILVLNANIVIAQVGVGAVPTAKAKIYFDGTKASQDANWQYWAGPGLKATMPLKWNIEVDPTSPLAGCMNSNDPVAAGGKYGWADLVTKENFRDFRAHVEFLIKEPLGNSGVYLQNRYEIQVLDGDSTSHGMGAIINQSYSPYKQYNGVGKWNAYDINFRAARFKNGILVEKPLVTVYFNGVKVHQNVYIDQVWGGPNSGIDGGNDGGKGITDVPGGLKLQAEGHNVLYRNIWIEKKKIKKANTNF